MKPAIIVMLTRNDVTVDNAQEVFRLSKALPVQHWGFKDVGLPPPKVIELAKEMKDAGKRTYLEVVSLGEDEGLNGAALAVEAGFDVLMGTAYCGSIQALLEGTSTEYFPFAGHVHSHPSVLDGTIQDIASHADFLQDAGVDGIDLLAYRFVGDAEELLQSVVSKVSIPVVSAGSIGSFERIREVQRAGAWAFTMGSALFDGAFVEGRSFQDNLRAVLDWCDSEGAVP
jgi:hypothetical protein